MSNGKPQDPIRAAMEVPIATLREMKHKPKPELADSLRVPFVRDTLEMLVGKPQAYVMLPDDVGTVDPETGNAYQIYGRYYYPQNPEGLQDIIAISSSTIPPEGRFSFRNTIAHEFGHKFLGDSEDMAEEFSHIMNALSATQDFTPKQAQGIYRALRKRGSTSRHILDAVLANDFYAEHPMRKGNK